MILFEIHSFKMNQKENIPRDGRIVAIILKHILFVDVLNLLIF